MYIISMVLFASMKIIGMHATSCDRVLLVFIILEWCDGDTLCHRFFVLLLIAEL